MSDTDSRFKPIGNRARWVPIYERLKELGPNELLSYEDMGLLAGLDHIDDRSTLGSAARRAAKQLENVDRRTCRIERGHGYRIATPEHQVELAKRHQKLAVTHVDRAHTKIATIDLNQIDPETRKIVGLMAHSLAEQGRFMRTVDVRQSRLEQAMQLVVQGQRETVERVSSHEHRTAEELAAVRAQLAELANKVGHIDPEPPALTASPSASPPPATDTTTATSSHNPPLFRSEQPPR